ncbi:MFS general substrate transporter [Marasmius fiardii PR-910]|nr:MFS general substrate transporter [Marasmius fiardii PR-910]
MGTHFDYDSNHGSSEVVGQLGAKQVRVAAQDYDEGLQRRVLRKVDKRIMPLVLLQYLVMRIDVNNVSNVAILNVEQGTDIKTQLHLSAQQWVWVVACFYYPYMLLEPASTVLLKKSSAPVWLSRIMVTWGILTCCVAAVKSYGSLIALRVLIGAAEAGYFPCIIYFWTFWYTPAELAIRVAALYSMSALSGFVGGFLAYAISFANGRLAGWQWLYIIEGLIPIAVGILTYFVLPSYPDRAHWLTEEERNVVIKHLHQDAPKVTGKTWSWSAARLLFIDPTFYTFTFSWICAGVGGNGISYALPQVIKDLGFVDSRMSNVLTMPPAFASFSLVLVLGHLVRRGLINPFPTVVVLDVVLIACYIVLITVEVVGVRYFILIVSTAASLCIYPMLWPKRVQALRGTAMTGLAIGLHNASAQFSGILGPQIFSPAYGPKYIVSYKVSVGLLAGAITFHLLTWLLMHGPIQKYMPSLARRIQSQTQIRKRDLEANSAEGNESVDDAESIKRSLGK